ncbi:MAG: hypothetical protein ABSA53_09055 [Streptosporangiaceae bacterium]
MRPSALLGLTRLIKRFPGVTGLATAGVLAQAAPRHGRVLGSALPRRDPRAGEKLL